MSKAFTKDDGPDEAPVPRRRAPLPAGTPNYVTERGLAALRAEHEALGPAPDGDPSNVAHQAETARRLELEERIATAVLVPPPADKDEVRFGARVRLTGMGEARELQIVGVDEADPAGHLIAFAAPLARALLGRRAGETVSVRTPGGEEELTIESVVYGYLP